MTGTLVEIRHSNRESQRNFRLDKSLREAVRDHLKTRWPYGTAKAAAREYRLTEDRAREAAAGRGSLTTIEQIFKKGGPSVFLPIMEEVWGESIARYFTELGASYETNGKRLRALVGSGGPMAPPGRPDPADGSDALDDRPRSFTRRAG